MRYRVNLFLYTVLIQFALFAAFLFFVSSSHFVDQSVFGISPYVIFALLPIYCFSSNKNLPVHLFTELSIIYLTLFLAAACFATTTSYRLDYILSGVDALFGIQSDLVRRYISRHQIIKYFFDACYGMLPAQMLVCPIFCLARHRYGHFRRVLTILLSSSILGYFIFYVFPSFGPCSISLRRYLYDVSQQHTYMRYLLLQSYQPVIYSDGGLVACPSFHVLWSLISTAFLAFDPAALILGVILTTLISISTVLLSWHYVLDVFASLLLFVICFFLSSRKFLSRV